MDGTAADVNEPIVLVAVGGDGSPVAVPSPPPGSIVVAADSGLHLLGAAGLAAHHVVGDLDSVDQGVLDGARAAGAQVHRHPADKDATDLELALDLVRTALAPDHGIGRVVVVGAGGGRLDHLLADVLLLSSPSLGGLDVVAHLGPATVRIVRPGRPVALVGRPGEQVSLLPLHGSADGVSTSGLRWPLIDAHLAAGTTRAVSNELVGTCGRVAVRAGVLAAVQPGTVAAPIDPRTTSYDPTPRAAPAAPDHPEEDAP